LHTSQIYQLLMGLATWTDFSKPEFPGPDGPQTQVSGFANLTAVLTMTKFYFPFSLVENVWLTLSMGRSINL
jgi:hypothetical protein